MGAKRTPTGERGADWFPGIAWARAYRRADIRPDLVAGLAVTALLVPHGMAYAELAGLPAITGLYTTVLALLAYAMFGPSRVLLLGPDSSLAPLIAAAIVLVGADGDPGRAVATAGMLALLTGLLCVLAGLTGLGAIADLLSKPVRVGYLNGLAIVMIVTQLPKLFGFSASGDTAVEVAINFVEGLADGLTNGTSLAVGVGCLAVILVAGGVSPRAPGVLIAVVGSTLAVVVFDLTEHGVAVVGVVPEGFPKPDWPAVDIGDVPELLVAAVGIALMTLSDTTALSRSFADRTGDDPDPNREIIALGAANVSTALFQGFPVSASTTRTTVAVVSGGRTQLVGVFGAALVLLLLVARGSLVENIPSAALAAIVIGAGLKLFDLAILRWLASVRRSEFLLSLSATIGVVAVGVLEGIVIAVLLSLGNFIRRVWRPYDAVLGRVADRTGYHDVERHPDAAQVQGMLIYRFDAPLFFANADYFGQRLRHGVDQAPWDVQRVVIAGEPMTDIDTTGAEVLAQLLDEFDELGVSLAFAGLKGPVKDRLDRYGLLDRVGRHDFYSTISHAIDEYVYTTGVEWNTSTEGGPPDPSA